MGRTKKRLGDGGSTFERGGRGETPAPGQASTSIIDI